MAQFNIPIRNPSEAVRTQWLRNPNRKLNSRNIVAKGAPKRAETFRKNPQPAEVSLIQELDRRNIKYEFQYPVKSYILDFAFPAQRLDIELDNPRRAGRNLNRLAKTRNRISELQKLGWTAIYFRIDTNPTEIADKIISLLNHSYPYTSTRNMERQHSPSII